jgi:hypothetical protein
MATHASSSPYDLHDHSGARWLAAAGTPLIIAIIFAFAMMVYPYIR